MIAAQDESPSTGRSLFLASFASLFLELLLIRWVSTEIRIFAYISNLVLLACFLGFGLGCFLSARRIHLALTPAVLALLLAGIGLPSFSFRGQSLHPFRSITDFLGGFEDTQIWYASLSIERLGGVKAIAVVVAGLTGLLVLFALLALCLFPTGQLVGRFFDRSPNTVRAYSLNVAASLLGIWAFALLSFAGTDPRLWIPIALVLLLPFAAPGRGRLAYTAAALVAGGAALVLGRGAETGAKEVVWSPYQKLTLLPWGPTLVVHVNNVNFMSLADLSTAALRDRMPPAELARERAFNQYDLVFRLRPAAASVLILGAGGGNNAAGALRNGAARVEAVEIDPAIVDLGRRFHPEHPYDDPRVEVVVDDARAFLKRDRQRYDVISFGLLDSHTLVSAYNNTRLDHYVYTRESFAEAKRRLSADGVLTVLFSDNRAWIGDRIATMLEETFAQRPIALHPAGRLAAGGRMYVVGNDRRALDATLAADPELSGFLAQNAVPIGTGVAPTTDDWPYLYLRTPRVPLLHALVSLLLLAGFFLLRKLLLGGVARIDAHFFLLGAAFLLLEFQNVSKAALLLGSTWLVNAVVISGILLLILAANLWVSRVRVTSLGPCYALLALTLVGLYATPLASLATLPLAARALAAALLLNLPVFFAGVIFVVSFANAAEKSRALGSNLLGAATGGVLEALSYVTGIRSLLLVVLALYLLSAAVRGRRGAGAPASA